MRGAKNVLDMQIAIVSVAQQISTFRMAIEFHIVVRILKLLMEIAKVLQITVNEAPHVRHVLRTQIGDSLVRPQAQQPS